MESQQGNQGANDASDHLQIVLVHGITGSKRFFAALEEQLREDPVRGRTLSFDLLGFGENRDRSGPYGSIDQLQHMSKLIEERFPYGPLVLIGHSLGGVLVLCWAIQHASRVSAIVLLNTPLGESRDDISQSLLRGKFGWATLLLKHRQLTHLVCILIRGGHLMRFFRFMKPHWVPNEVFHDYCCHTWHSLSQSFDEILLGTPAGALIRQIRSIPILNLSGCEDEEVSRRNIAQSNVEDVVLQGGHLMLLEHPEPTMKAIDVFLMRALLPR